MRSHLRLAALAAVAIVATACGGTTTDGGAAPAPTEPATPTTSHGETPDDGTATLEQPAIWPAADVAFASPVEAAEDFVTRALGVPAALGEFMPGDGRSGEIEVGVSGEAGGTHVSRGLLLLRQLGPGDGWFVLAAPNDVVTIATLDQGEPVAAGPIKIAGRARGFEGNVVVTAFAAGDRDAVFDQQFTQAGSMEEPQPYEVTLDLAGARAGEIVVILVQGGTGREADPGDFAAIAVVVGAPDDTTMANPASIFCEEQGGTVEIVTADDGGQSGVCHLPDGTSVDEWDYYREHHP